MKHLLKLLDWTPEEIKDTLDLADKLKAEKKAGIPHRLCEGKNIALIFEKTSTRKIKRDIAEKRHTLDKGILI
mgnify:CR=1 FL=1